MLLFFLLIISSFSCRTVCILFSLAHTNTKQKKNKHSSSMMLFP
jgi:hypothetical protein